MRTHKPRAARKPPQMPANNTCLRIGDDVSAKGQAGQAPQEQAALEQLRGDRDEAGLQEGRGRERGAGLVQVWGHTSCKCGCVCVHACCTVPRRRSFPALTSPGSRPSHSHPATRLHNSTPHLGRAAAPGSA